MRTFWDPVQLEHAPRFFLQRGQLRPHFEVPARADALLDACQDMRLSIVQPQPPIAPHWKRCTRPDFLDFLRDAPAAWAALPDTGPELVPNVHPTPGDARRRRTARAARSSAALGWLQLRYRQPCRRRAPGPPPSPPPRARSPRRRSRRRQQRLRPGPPARPSRLCRAAGGPLLSEQCGACGGASAARRRARVAVLDIDSHHGNGTQGIFWDRDDVLFVSVHGDPDRYYPWFVGHAEERGGGRGRGLQSQPAAPVRHAPTRAGSPRSTTGLEAIRRFGAEALVVSLGFDASEDEPLNCARGHGGWVRPRGARDRRARAAHRDHPGGRLQRPRDRDAATSLPARVWRLVSGILAADDDRADPILRLLRHRGGAGRGAGADLAGSARLPRRRPARQGGGRSARAGAGGAHLHGPLAAAQAHPDQPGPGRPAQGRQPFRPADRAGGARRHGRSCPSTRSPNTPPSASSRSTARSTRSPACCPPRSARRSAISA